MSGHSLSVASLYRDFRDAPKADRPVLVADILAQNRDSFRCVVQIAATRSIDEDAFLCGLQAALGQDPENLPALRLLSWHQIRRGSWHEAKAVLRLLISCWPHIFDARWELVRVSMMDEAKEGEEILDFAVSKLGTPLARSSYGCQYALAGSKPAPDDRLYELKLNVDDFCGQILQESVAPDFLIPEQNRTVRLEMMEKILGAKSVALVANGPSLQGRRLGEEIDAHDFVIRCNFPELTKFGGDVGRKVDAVFFNETLMSMLPQLMTREPAYEGCTALAFHPEPGALFGEECYLRNGQGRVSRIQPKLREFYRSFFYTRPTTGLMGIILLSAVLRKEIDIYGFDFYSQSTAHYYPSSSPVFLGHELQYERWFLTHFLPWLGLGRVTAR